MKRKLIAWTLVLGLSLTLSGCFASTQNSIAKKGGFFTSNKENYIVINYSGNRIMDVWILPNTFVESEGTSDGCSFVDANGNSIILQGDVKIIRQNGSKTNKEYKEYHAEDDIIPYEEFIKK